MIQMSKTVHSVEEQQLDHINEDIANKYKTQIILTYSPVKEITVLHNRRIIEINPFENDNLIKDSLRRYIKPGYSSIYSEVSDTDYNKVQQDIIVMFSTERRIKMVRSTKRANEMTSEQELHKQIFTLSY